MPYVDVVGGVARFALQHVWSNGRPVINVLDVHIFDRGITTSREEALLDQANILAGAWAGDIMPFLSDNLSFTGVSWLDLDSADGGSGATAYGPQAGGEVLPTAASPNVAYLVHKLISGARGRRSGRMYLAGVSESAVDENGVTGIPADLDPAFGTFKDEVEQSGSVVAPSYQSRIVVVHLGPHPKPIPLGDEVVEGSYSDVQEFQLDGTVATQRRRLRG